METPVNFTYPTGEGDLFGKLIDRVVVFDSEYGSIVYWNMVDLIKFEGEDEKWLGITYYRYNKEKRRWVYAGQTSKSEPISSFDELFVKAIKKKEWMRQLFIGIYEKCSARTIKSTYLSSSVLYVSAQLTCIFSFLLKRMFVFARRSSRSTNLSMFIFRRSLKS